jgi:hypothetical protein
MINQYDVVESLINIPKENLYIGDEGTVVEDFDDNYCMVEFLQDCFNGFWWFFLF